MEYTLTKKIFTKNDINFMYIFFDNGDHVEVKGSEVVKASVNTFDRLVRHEYGACPIAAGGFIKLNISNKHRFVYASKFLYNLQEFEKDRKTYIKDRCVYQSRITELWLFNSDNWHYVLLGEISAKIDGDYLILEFHPQTSMGIISDDYYTINLPNVTKDAILNIDLDFENCESFVVYHDEILEINLDFYQELVWGASEFYRKVKSGYIKLKLDKERLCREYNFLSEKILRTKDFERRLCGKTGEKIHDICHLYLTYREPGYARNLRECIDVGDIKSDEEIEWLENEEETGEFYYYFEGGCSKKLKDGTIVIAFGKNAQNLSGN